MSDNINTRCILKEIHDRLGRDDFRRLSYLSKDVIKHRKRMGLGNSLDLFLALEEKTAINYRSRNFSLLEEMFRLMGRRDIVSMLTRYKEDVFTAECKNTLTDKRILLFNIGEETGERELDHLKKCLCQNGVRKRELDRVADVWDVLDLLEERIPEADHWSFFHNTFEEFEDIKTVLNESMQKDKASEGATGCQPETFPVQEEGHMEITNGDEPIADSNIQAEVSMRQQEPLTLDGSPSGFSSTARGSGLGVYDKGARAGRCIIINNERFNDERRLTTRTGTNVDRDRLKEMFTSFGFVVSTYNNQSHAQVLDILNRVQREDHQENGALVVCCLSHGSLNTISGSCGEDISISTMTSLFRADNCPSLSGKPKFFIFQACQGSETQNVWHGTQTTTRVEFDVHRVPSMPGAEVTPENISLDQLDIAAAESDFLVAQSTMPGYISLRDEKKGSFFVQSLVKHLKEHSPREDVVSILVEVNRDVSRRKGTTREGHLAVQIPEPKVRLTRKFYLYPIETEV